MPDTPEIRSVVDAAVQAAATGDYVSAEQLLREVARLQEASFGALHPDLANTLNNLGVVCEFTGKPVDAERFFRQAWSIAAAVLAPDDPFVATSRKNLEDFCAILGKAVDSPTPTPAVALERDARETGSADRRLEPSYEASRPVVSRRWSHSFAIGGLIAGGLLVTFMATALWFRSNDEVEPPPSEPISTDVPREITTTRRGSAGVEPGTRNTASATPAGPQPPVVAAAHLCRDLLTGRRGESSDWQCIPPSLPVDPGPLFFYTRVKSPTDTTVQHRWFRGDRLRQVVELRIRANTTTGYRTYSRNAVDSQGAGDWRVELRTNAGVMLHEERFVVR